MINIIANPNSGLGRGKKNIEKISRYCIKNGIEHAFHFTERPGHATEIAAELTKNGGEIAVMGGDGSFHETLNGIADLKNTTLGFIPSGRGNDFARSANLSLDPIKAFEAIVRGKTKQIDFIKVGEKRCLNVAGTGLDIDVLERVAGSTNKITYVISLIYCLKHFEPYHVAVNVNGETHEFDCIMAGVCNGKAFGGNIRLAPIAKIDDGKLDVIVMTMPKDGKIMKVLPKFIKGKHMDMPLTHHFVCDEVKIETSRPIELDGEIYRNLGFDCSIVKGGLRTYITE